MKGLAGIVYPDVFQMNNLIEPMMQTLKHRNGKLPGDIYTYKNIQIGACQGKFATDEQNSILAGIDGTIANSEDITNELTRLGHHIKGKEASELIVHAYKEWDTSIFEHLKGEFAVLIFDQNKKKMILCRDRIGKKPLYWFQNQHFFIFASELKAILATGAVPQTPALDALSSYLYFGYIPQDMTPIMGINKLLPAHYLQFHFDGSKTIESYWSYSSCFEIQKPIPLNTIVSELGDMLKKNITQSVSKNEKIGCFLSGGLGAASITYDALKLFPKENITTYTVGFAGENDDEFLRAENVAATLGLEHETFSLTQKNFLDDLVKIVWHLDEPLADPHILSTWKLASLASKNVNIVLSGMGSDELFAGHSRYSLAEQGDSAFRTTSQYLLKAAQKAMIPVFNILYKPLAFRLLKQSRTNVRQFDYLKQVALMTENEIYDASPRLGGIFDPEVFLHKFYQIKRIPSTTASYRYFDMKTSLPDEYLMQFERITASHSINWTAPFLDKNVVEYLARLPEPEYLSEHETASYLKAMLRGVFPDSFIDKPKRTNKHFLKKWLIQEKMKEIFELLLNGTLVETGIISPHWLQTKISRIEIEPFAFKHLWAILILEIWFRLFVNESIQPQAPQIGIKQFLEEPS